MDFWRSAKRAHVCPPTLSQAYPVVKSWLRHCYQQKFYDDSSTVSCTTNDNEVESFIGCCGLKVWTIGGPRIGSQHPSPYTTHRVER